MCSDPWRGAAQGEPGTELSFGCRMVSFLLQPPPPTQKEDLTSWKLGLVLWAKQHPGAWEEAVLSHWPFFVSSGPRVSGIWLPSLEDESVGILGS